ncbi:F-box/LRR-repeat protein 17-like [Pseudonaja textilis]|uniref:F-box/LRR-repeat protein 17-like n=1 Tax=Pseudonaja textilis TaxID=8673 RepID=UPI000EA8ACD8|nr:F-box/LRR-repeat protein 17-like [Pseudonaja textilis]
MEERPRGGRKARRALATSLLHLLFNSAASLGSSSSQAVASSYLPPTPAAKGASWGATPRRLAAGPGPRPSPPAVFPGCGEARVGVGQIAGEGGGEGGGGGGGGGAQSPRGSAAHCCRETLPPVCLLLLLQLSRAPRARQAHPSTRKVENASGTFLQHKHRQARTRLSVRTRQPMKVPLK